MSKPLGSCAWNGNEIVQKSAPNHGVAGLAPDSPDEWGPIFAAAPDLLEALEEFLCYEAPDCAPQDAWDKARAAIAKARGQS